jgi:modification methylase
VEVPQSLTVTTGSVPDVADLLPEEARRVVQEQGQKAPPAVAKDQALMQRLAQAVRALETHHTLILGDSRDLTSIPDESVHLVVTSPPYWTLKRYHGTDGQLGNLAEYDEFLAELDKVWQHVFRALVPGGRLVVVVGDVCLSRRAFGRHVVVPLHASIQEHCRQIGFDNLAPIIWYKIANAQFEVENGGGGFLGKPYEPNAVIKNDIEYILFQRKSGGYRQPSLDARLLSVIAAGDHKDWFQQIWNLPGASTRHHPAPFPLALAERLIRMFSFAGDTVLDPFMGTGTTSLAASMWGRHSIGVELEPPYFEIARRRLQEATEQLLLGVSAD